MEHSVTLVLPGSLVLCVVISLGVAGCNAADNDQAEGFDASRPRAWLPILYYEASRTEAEVATCMKRNGFTYIPRAPADVVQVADIDEADPMREAKDHGFRLWTDENMQTMPPEDKNLPYVQSLTRSELDAYSKALSDPFRGCVAEANRKLAKLINQVHSLRSEFRDRVSNNVRMQVVRSRVASCMLPVTGAKGLTNRLAAIQWLRAKHPKDVDTERHTAVALATCEAEHRATIVMVNQEEAKRFGADHRLDLGPLFRNSSGST